MSEIKYFLLYTLEVSITITREFPSILKSTELICYVPIYVLGLFFKSY